MLEIPHVSHLHRRAGSGAVGESDAAVEEGGELLRAIGAVEADVKGVRCGCYGCAERAGRECCVSFLGLGDEGFFFRVWLPAREELEVRTAIQGAVPVGALDGDDAGVDGFDILDLLVLVGVLLGFGWRGLLRLL